MIKIVYKTGIIFVALLIVMTSGGISLYQHYCSCENTSKISVFTGNIDCHDAEVAGSANSVSCCTVSDEDYHEQPSCESEGNCCDTEFTFLEVDSFDLVKTGLKDFRFLAAYCQVLESQESQISSFVKVFFDTESGISPPKSGRDLIISFHQLKIPTSVV